MSTRWITLPARYLSAGWRVCGDYGGHAGLSVLDFTLAITLGGIMLLTLFIMPPLFYRAEKAPGRT
ncbi:hypothetical protein ACSR9E_14830 [Citrobacter koseri]|uniref:hypothetical protein n=1 Tax=Citrobacter koseri TaxID=545 RepID=UPI00404240BF